MWLSRRSIAPWLAVASAKAGCAKCNLQNGADGRSNIEGKAARVAASASDNERVSNREPRCGDTGELGSTGCQHAV
jgi:hypothetical protein